MPQPQEAMPVEKQDERAPIGKWKVEEDYLDGIHLPSWFPAHLTGNGNPLAKGERRGCQIDA